LWDLAGKITASPDGSCSAVCPTVLRAYALSGTLRGPRRKAAAAERYLAAAAFLR